MFIYATIGQYFPNLRLPLFWGINIVPMAIIFFYIGHIIDKEILNKRAILIFSTILLILFIILDMQGVVNHELKMKWEAYGIPIVNVLLALSGIIIVYNFAKLFSQIKIIKTIFIALGKASLIIMFLHQAIRQIVFSRLPFFRNDWIILLVTLACCYCVYYGFTLLPLTRKIFLGEYSRRD